MMPPSPKLAIVCSHPVQYYTPLLREISRLAYSHVFYAHVATPKQQSAAGFGQDFDWDIDLLSGYSHSFLKNLARAPSTSKFSGCDTPEIGACLRKGRFDALLTFGWHLKSMAQAFVAAKLNGIPVMVRGDSHLSTPRGNMKSAVKRFAYPVFLRTFNAALFVGRKNRQYYTHYQYPEDHLFYSPHCVDTKRFALSVSGSSRASLRERLGVPQDSKVVLFAGKLMPFKRPLDVVEATARLHMQDSTVRLLVAGSGELQKVLVERAEACGLPCDLLGFQNQTEMPAVYAAADLLVLPSDGRETWGLVCNEALACGTPIVVSDQVGCAPDLAGDNWVGRVFPMGDVHALCNAMKATLSDPPSPSAIKVVSERHSVSAAATGVLEALEFITRKQ